jgi:hypothetical protein
MSRRRKNAGTGYGMQFHGSFAEKSDAKRKERQVGGFIKRTSIKGKSRYTVMSERKNPIRRKKKNPSGWSYQYYYDPNTQEWSARYGNDMGHGRTKAAAKRALEERMGPSERRPRRRHSRNPNPMDLVVMGANPKPREITLQPGEQITFRMNPIVNPSAETIRESFVGKPVDYVFTSDEPHMQEANYAMLGKLLTLYVKPMHGGQVQMISGKGIKVVSDESAQQIWFVGGDQDVTDQLDAFGAREVSSGRWQLGEATRIDYKQRKEHVPKPEIDEWEHHFGEEGGSRPTVLFDSRHKRLLLEGGDYHIESDGIIN